MNDKTATKIIDCLELAVNSFAGATVARKNQPGVKLKALLASNFTGCAEGPEEGSVNYKKYVADYFDDKYPDR